MYYDKHYAPTLFHHDDDNKACRVIHIYQLFSPNQIAECFEVKVNCLFHEGSQYTGVWKYCSVYKILRRLSKNRLYTEMLRVHSFSIFIIKTPQALTALAPLGLVIINTLTNVLLL